MRHVVPSIALALLAGAAPGWGEVPSGGEAPLRVLVYDDPPFVMRDGDGWSGLVIDLWTEVARKAGLDWQIVGAKGPEEIVAAVAGGSADVGLGDIRVTRDRARRVDFTQPFFRTGLRTMVRERGGQSALAVLRDLLTPAHAWLLLGTAAVLAVASALVFRLARRHDAENFPSERAAGVVEALYVVTHALLKGEIKPKLLPGVFARILSIVWMGFGTIVVAYFTAAVASVLTVHQTHNIVQELGDLRGRAIAAVAQTYEVGWLRARGFSVVEEPEFEAAVAALLDQRADAVVHDQPVMAWWLRRHAGAGVRLIGDVFDRADCAMVLAPRSPLRVRINIAMLDLEESGFREALDHRWLGAN